VPVTPLFDTGDEFAVIRGDLHRLNYTKTVFGWGSAPDPPRKLTSRLAGADSGGSSGSDQPPPV